MSIFFYSKTCQDYSSSSRIIEVKEPKPFSYWVKPKLNNISFAYHICIISRLCLFNQKIDWRGLRRACTNNAFHNCDETKPFQTDKVCEKNWYYIKHYETGKYHWIDERCWVSIIHYLGGRMLFRFVIIGIIVCSNGIYTALFDW